MMKGEGLESGEAINSVDRETVAHRSAVVTSLSSQSPRSAKQRFQQLFFPEGIAFDGNGFVGTA